LHRCIRKTQAENVDLDLGRLVPKSIIESLVEFHYAAPERIGSVHIMAGRGYKSLDFAELSIYVQASKLWRGRRCFWSAGNSDTGGELEKGGSMRTYWVVIFSL
jgi:hypothetical protein